MLPRMPDHGSIVDHLVAELRTGRIESVAFVVPSDARWTLPLYDLAITTARRGWQLGIPAATYWFVTPEPEPLASLGAEMGDVAHERLEPEGITFIGSTYAEVRHGVVLLDPQAERIEPDLIVGLNRYSELLLDWGAVRRGWIDHIVAEPASATSGSPTNGASQRRLVAA
jgi:hypothetical protein